MVLAEPRLLPVSELEVDIVAVVLAEPRLLPVSELEVDIVAVVLAEPRLLPVSVLEADIVAVVLAEPRLLPVSELEVDIVAVVLAEPTLLPVSELEADIVAVVLPDTWEAENEAVDVLVAETESVGDSVGEPVSDGVRVVCNSRPPAKANAFWSSLSPPASAAAAAAASDSSARSQARNMAAPEADRTRSISDAGTAARRRARAGKSLIAASLPPTSAAKTPSTRSSVTPSRVATENVAPSFAQNETRCASGTVPRSSLPPPLALVPSTSSREIRQPPTGAVYVADEPSGGANAEPSTGRELKDASLAASTRAPRQASRQRARMRIAEKCPDCR